MVHFSSLLVFGNQPEILSFPGGILITASHNPLEWNGLKFILQGRGIYENELGKIIEQQKISSSKIGKETMITSDYISESINGVTEYLLNKTLDDIIEK